MTKGGFLFFPCFLRIAAFLLLPLSVHAEWRTHDLEVDGTPVKLAFPEEYKKAADDDPGLNNSRALMPEFMVFANYRTDTPFKFIQVQMPNAVRSYRYTKESFAEVLQATKAQLPNFDTKDIKATFDQRLDNLAAGTVKLLKPVLLPLAGESDHHFIVPILLGMNIEKPTPHQVVVVCASVTISLNSRLVCLQVYFPYKDKTTATQASELAAEIARQTLAANK